MSESDRLIRAGLKASASLPPTGVLRPKTPPNDLRNLRARRVLDELRASIQPVESVRPPRRYRRRSPRKER